MHLTFDLDYGSRAFPGPLGGSDAAMGELWVGPGALLGTLETALGLGGPRLAGIERAAALVPTVRQVEGFWSRSAEVDALATARTLVRWRDLLWEGGWRGQKCSERLGQLAEVTRNVLPGRPDRLHAVATALQTRGTEIERVTLVEPLEELSAQWRAVLRGLELRGTRVEVSRLTPAGAKGDLLAARTPGFKPKRDGSLQLVRPPAPLAAADAVAAWLAAEVNEQSPALPHTVIVGTDAVLDEALHRYGLPTTGAAADPYDNALVQILPLVVAMGWKPADPQRALELVTLPISPVPRHLARGLAEALQDVPAVDSNVWRGALAQGLEEIEDAGRRQRVRTRLDGLLTSRIPHSSHYPVRELDRRLGVLLDWLRARQATDESDSEMWLAPLGQIEALQRILELTGQTEFTAPELGRLLQDASSGLSGPVRFPAEAGAWAVSRPGQIGGAAERVIWWGFTRESAPSVERLPFTRQEQKALAKLGVELPDPGLVAIANARRWRRPLLQTTRKLLLVCPEQDAGGEESHPHPLWDELAAHVAEGSEIDVLRAELPWRKQPVPRSTRELVSTPLPMRAWKARGKKIQQRDPESPSSLGTLLGCSFKWAVHYAGRIRSGLSAELATGPLLIGTLAHTLFERVLQEVIDGARGAPKTAEAASKRVQKLFSEEGPRLAAEYFLPGADARRAQVQHMLSDAASELFRMLVARKLRVRGVEQEFQTKALGTTLKGRADLVLDQPLSIVDLKFGAAGYRAASLRDGTALQLAAYSHAARQRGTYPPVAYFIIASQRLLTTNPEAFPGAEALEGPSAQETWEATAAAYDTAWAEVRRGNLVAPAINEEGQAAKPIADRVEEGRLVLSPPCRYCEYGALCGNAFVEGA